MFEIDMTLSPLSIPTVVRHGAPPVPSCMVRWGAVMRLFRWFCLKSARRSSSKLLLLYSCGRGGRPGKQAARKGQLHPNQGGSSGQHVGAGVAAAFLAGPRAPALRILACSGNQQYFACSGNQQCFPSFRDRKQHLLPLSRHSFSSNRTRKLLGVLACPRSAATTTSSSAFDRTRCAGISPRCPQLKQKPVPMDSSLLAG